MPVSRQSLSGPSDAMESDDWNDPLDIFIRKAIARVDSPLQWVPLVHPFGPDLPGWPLLTPVKVQLQKCDKCSKEFCSPMNYRRHIRMHRRSLNVDKESHKNRDFLGAFWDKLSLEESGRVVSFDDISLEGVSGSLIVNAWASSLQKPAVLVLPQVYLRAGSVLLEIIQAKSSRIPISSQDLFSILDETSEGTFLSAGTAESVQKFVVDGGAEKALDLRNLVASTSLLFEQKLVKAWLAEKDAEALRCQKILVDEEEVAQKRQAQTLERKRRKKLRQKELKARGQSNGEKTDSNAGEKTDINADSIDSIADFVEGTASAETSIPHFLCDNGSDTVTDPKSCLEQINSSGKENELEEAHCDDSSTHVGMDSIKNVRYPREWATNGLYQSKIGMWKVAKSYRRGRQVVVPGSQNLHASKLEVSKKQGPANEMNTLTNGGKVWAIKSKGEIDEESSRITAQNVVAKSANDLESSGTSLQNAVAKGAIDEESSRTTLQNIVAKNDVETSRTSWRNIVSKGVSKGAIGAENLRTTLQNVVAKSGNDVESSGTSLQNVGAKGATDEESSRTTLQNVVAKNDVETSRTSWRNIVSKGAIGIENLRTTLVAKSENDVESSRTSIQNLEKGAIDVAISRTTLQNGVVAKTANDVESSRTSLQNVFDSHMGTSNSKLLIGSLSVPVRKYTAEQQVSQGETTDSSEKCAKSDAVLKGQDPAVATTGDVCVYEMRGNLPDRRGNQTSGENDIGGTVAEQQVRQGETTYSSDKCAKSDAVLKGQDPAVATTGDTYVYEMSGNQDCGDNDIGGKVAEQQVSQGETTDLSDKRAKLDAVLKGQDPAVATMGDVCVYEMRDNQPDQRGNQNCGENDIGVTVAEQQVSQGETTDSSDKCAKSDAVLKGQDPAVATTGDVCVYEMRGNLPDQRGNRNCGENDIGGTVEDQTVIRLQSSVSKLNFSISYNRNAYMERNVQPKGTVFSSFDVKAFLAQRWKDAMASDHVKLELSPEPPSDAEGTKDCSLLVQESGGSQHCELEDAETPVASVEPHVSFIKENSKAKFRKKTERCNQEEA